MHNRIALQHQEQNANTKLENYRSKFLPWSSRNSSPNFLQFSSVPRCTTEHSSIIQNGLHCPPASAIVWVLFTLLSSRKWFSFCCSSEATFKLMRELDETYIECLNTSTCLNNSYRIYSIDIIMNASSKWWLYKGCKSDNIALWVVGSFN